MRGTYLGENRKWTWHCARRTLSKQRFYSSSGCSVTRSRNACSIHKHWRRASEAINDRSDERCLDQTTLQRRGCECGPIQRCQDERVYRGASVRYNDIAPANGARCIRWRRSTYAYDDVQWMLAYDVHAIDVSQYILARLSYRVRTACLLTNFSSSDHTPSRNNSARASGLTSVTRTSPDTTDGLCTYCAETAPFEMVRNQI